MQRPLTSDQTIQHALRITAPLIGCKSRYLLIAILKEFGINFNQWKETEDDLLQKISLSSFDYNKSIYDQLNELSKPIENFINTKVIAEHESWKEQKRSEREMKRQTASLHSTSQPSNSDKFDKSFQRLKRKRKILDFDWNSDLEFKKEVLKAILAS